MGNPHREKDETTVITQDDFEKSVLGYLSKSDPVTPELIRKTIHFMLIIQTPRDVIDIPVYTNLLCHFLRKKLLGGLS